MDRQRWERVAPILDEVLDLPIGDRVRRLETVLKDDPDLRTDVLAFLDADVRHGGVLDSDSRAFIEDALRAFETGREGRLLPGVRVAARYRIVSLLGRGGMGEVYRADDLRLGQSVALKFLPRHLQQNPAYLQRLLDETRLARQISHPNVCRVYDIGEWEDRQFLSMEYIDGEDLASLIASAAAESARHRPSALRRSLRCASARHRAPRPEALERDARRARPGTHH
jgi:hypothetical protein